MPTTQNSGKRILIVEDEGLIAADIQNRLERLGYSVSGIAHSGERALESARATPFDLVLMDIRLKGNMDGIATAQALKSEWDAPVVYITAHADPETISRAKLTEPLGYIVKPVVDADLSSTVQIALYKHQMERRLRTSEAWLGATLTSIGEGVIATNTDGAIVFMNPVAENLTGWSMAESRGRLLMEVLELYEELSSSPVKNPLIDLFGDGQKDTAIPQTYVLHSRTGNSTAVELACFENRSAERLGAVLIVRDITNRREWEARLTQAQRMEAVANLAGGLARDFSNQLMVILGFAEALCSELAGSQRADAHQIKHAALLASSMTNQLLTLGRGEASHPEVLHLNRTLLELVPILTRSLGRARTLLVDPGLSAGLVRVDRSQLNQVLLNLALHAREAMSPGGTLRIETSQVEIREDELPKQRRAGCYARLRITVMGEAMDPAMLASIFEPFSMNRKAGFGAGLGLSIVHSIVTQSGGSITATNDGDRGTTFEILLPRVGDLAVPGDSRKPAGEAGQPFANDTQTVEQEQGVHSMTCQRFG